jgi:hypothetical protein
MQVSHGYLVKERDVDILVTLSFCTNKKENQIFLIYNEIQNGAIAKSNMTICLLIYGEIFAHFSYIRKPFLIYDFATAPF